MTPLKQLVVGGVSSSSADVDYDDVAADPTADCAMNVQSVDLFDSDSTADDAISVQSILAVLDADRTADPAVSACTSSTDGKARCRKYVKAVKSQPRI